MSGVDAAVRATAQPWELHCVRGDGGFAMVAGRVASTYPRAGGPGSVVQIVDAPTQLGRAAARLLDQVDYRGPCAMSVTERDGRFWFHDVRPGPGSYTPPRAHGTVLDLGRPLVR